MSTDTSGGTQSEQPRQRRILVEDILDGLIARVSGVLQPHAASTTTPEVTAQVQEVVQLAQQLKGAVSRLRQLDPAVLSEGRSTAAPQI
jgi:hypothetical protein